MHRAMSRWPRPLNVKFMNESHNAHTQLARWGRQNVTFSQLEYIRYAPHVSFADHDWYLEIDHERKVGKKRNFRYTRDMGTHAIGIFDKRNKIGGPADMGPLHIVVFIVARCDDIENVFSALDSCVSYTHQPFLFVR